MNRIEELFFAMSEHDKGRPDLIQHFTKVFWYSHLIGISENLDEKTQMVLEGAAIVHDIGILASEEKYGNCAGPHQEELGPAEAEEMLRKLGWEEDLIERISWLVGHHHTYTHIDTAEYRALVEADFLVNLYENHADTEKCAAAYERIFRTECGKKLYQDMFQ